MSKLTVHKGSTTKVKVHRTKCQNYTIIYLQQYTRKCKNNNNKKAHTPESKGVRNNESQQ